MTHQNSTTALPGPKSGSSSIKRKLLRKERLRIYDTLQNVDNEMSKIDAIIDMLSDKAQYCLDLCIDAGLMMQHARDEHELLREALKQKNAE